MTIIKEIERAVLNEDTRKLEEIVYLIDDVLLEEGRFAQELYDGIICFIQKTEFLKFKGSWHLIKLFEENLEILSEKQKELLLEILQEIFHDFENTTSCFLIAEIIVELFLDENSLNALINLNKGQNLKNRALIPHGLQHLVKRGKDSIVTKKALIELRKMKNDLDKNVSEQAKFEYATLNL